MSNKQTGFLFGASLKDSEIYNPLTKNALLVPGIQLGAVSKLNEVNGVGIIDSGIFSEHPQLKGLVLAEKSFVGDNPVDNIGHGTAVALQLLRSYTDSTPEEYPVIISAKVTNEYGEPNVEAVIQAIHWVVSKGAMSINISLGFPGEKKDYAKLCEVISSYNHVMFSAAAGNLGKDVKVYPAACGGRVLSVAESQKGKIVKSSGVGTITSSTDNAFFVEFWNYYLRSGLAEMKLGNYSKAADLFNESLLHKTNVGALFQVALINIKTDKPELSIIPLDKAIKLDPELMALRVHKGAALHMLEEYDEAVKTYLTVLAVDGKNQMALYNLAITLEVINQYGDAIEYLQKLKNINPDYPGVDRVLGRLKGYLK